MAIPYRKTILMWDTQISGDSCFPMFRDWNVAIKTFGGLDTECYKVKITEIANEFL